MNELEKKFNADLEERVEKMESVGWTNAFKKGAGWALKWFSRQQWMSVTEKLPADNTTVLMCNSKDGWVAAGFCIAGEWFNEFDNSECPCYPSHWMPKPQPPKSKSLTTQ